MRFSGLSLALAASASSALASAIPSARDECFAAHHDTLADYSDCGSRTTLSSCLGRLSSASDIAALEACYASAGCSSSAAQREAQYALSRCDELQILGELRRRHEAMLSAEAAAAGAAMPVMTPAPTLFARTAAKGDDCFSLEVHTSTICPVEVNDGKATTQSCRPGPVTSKSCRPGWLCTVDPNGGDICMEKVDKLDIGGIIIAIVFAVLIVAGISFLTYMSCAESRAQKRLSAKAEATALARAATRKKRAEEVRAPLMAQQQPQPEYHEAHGGANPFGDGQRH